MNANFVTARLFNFLSIMRAFTRFSARDRVATLARALAARSRCRERTLNLRLLSKLTTYKMRLLVATGGIVALGALLVALFDDGTSAIDWTPRAAGKCLQLHAATLTRAQFNSVVEAGWPAVIRGAAAVPELATAAGSWSQASYLLSKFGDVRVQASLSDSTTFEAVEPAGQCAGAESFWQVWRRGGESKKKPYPTSADEDELELLSRAGSKLARCTQPGPDCVRHILDKVVVRPASTESTLRQVLTGTEGSSAGGTSAYVQYEGVPQAMQGELRSPEFAASLRPDFVGLWLGRGATSAHLHHDANENLLLMVRGSKRWRLLPPSAGDALHEGLMLEVQQVVRASRPSEGNRAQPGGGDSWPPPVARAAVGLSNASLSFFTSPVDLNQPDFERFPSLKALLKTGGSGGGVIEVELQPGEMLFLPAWWWHQVKTTPAEATEGEAGDGVAAAELPWSAAVNWWFHPLRSKPMACATCELRPNLEHYPEGLYKRKNA